MTMNRVFNFGAGPATLPLDVLSEIKQELLDWNNLGLSVLEVGHRTAAFVHLLDETENKLRELLTIPANYKVLFLGAPARLQFSMIPMNLLPTAGEQGAYIVSGLWSANAFEEAKRLKKACLFSDIRTNSQTKYVYYTANETVDGLRSPLPQTTLPIVADMTSCLLTEPINISDYSLIFAGAQKNIANANLTVVIIKEGFLTPAGRNNIPAFLDYRNHIDSKSLYTTPPIFSIYTANKMFSWLKSQGGVQAMYLRNLEKSALLYAYIDSTNFYHCPVLGKNRSLVNICFSLRDTSLDAAFVHGAECEGLVALQGHRSKGGMRVSLYNAMPIEGVFKLIKFMKDFAEVNT